MTRTINTPNSEIHIGDLIKQYLTVNKISRAALARKISVSDASVLSYQKRAGGNTATLIVLSHALKHNFFADLAALLPADYSKNEPIDDGVRQNVAQLEKEIEILKAEKAVLLQAFGNK